MTKKEWEGKECINQKTFFLLLVIGTYLLRNGDAVVQFAFRDSNEKQNGSIDTLFVLFMKLAGLGLIIYAIPETLQLISNATFAATVRGIDIHPQTDFIILHLASTLVKLLLGFYLLISGKIFYKLGFPDTQE